MVVYKMFRIKNEKLYPLYVLANEEMIMGEWLMAKVGPVADDGNHVKSRLGKLALRPGFHSTLIPFTDWIGKKQNGELVQRKDTVWCECEVRGTETKKVPRWGFKELIPGFYKFKTNSKQKKPWIISDNIRINRILSHDEVKEICLANGVVAQEIEVA